MAPPYRPEVFERDVSLSGHHDRDVFHTCTYDVANHFMLYGAEAPLGKPASKSGSGVLLRRAPRQAIFFG